MMEIRSFEEKWKVTEQAQKKFVESFDFENEDNNFKYDFKTMTKKFGGTFIEYSRAAWVACKDSMTPEEFCKINANMPIGFFNNKIK